jgi:hypothetical protein
VQSSPDRANKVMQWLQSERWRPVLLGIVLALGWTYAAAADASQEATQTTLTVAASNAGPRTKVTLTAHVAPLNGSEAVGGVVNFRAAGAQGLNSDLGSAAVDDEGNAVLITDNLAAGNSQVVAAWAMTRMELPSPPPSKSRPKPLAPLRASPFPLLRPL